VNYVPAITLTAEESEMLASITFDPEVYLHDAAAFQTNEMNVPKLMALLEGRNAIPSARLGYFNDPKVREGKRTKGSHRNLFERNGISGDEIYQHASFLKYLYYFVYGPKLPGGVIAKFAAEVQSASPVSPGDVIDIANAGKRLVRSYGLDPSDAAEEFLKLCLDCGVYLSHARGISDIIAKMRVGT